RAPGLEGETTWFELLGGRRFGRKVTGAARPKDPSQYRVLGRSGPRIDMEPLVTGAAVFVQDLRLPGMLHARGMRPPRSGARLVSLDDSEVTRMAGVVRVVRDGSFVAVAAESSVQAVAAVERLRKAARWSGGAGLPEQSHLYPGMRAAEAKSFP